MVEFRIIEGDWGYAVTVYCVHVLKYQFWNRNWENSSTYILFEFCDNHFFFLLLFCHYRKSTYFEIAFYLFNKILWYLPDIMGISRLYSSFIDEFYSQYLSISRKFVVLYYIELGNAETYCAMGNIKDIFKVHRD